MEKIIKIGDKDVRISNNLAWTMEYRDQFGRDVVSEHLPMMATLVELVASVMGDTGKTKGITVLDIVKALEGRTIDIMLPLSQAELLTTVTNVTWAMAKAADESIEPPKQWVRQFDSFHVDEIGLVVYEMAVEGLSSKNLGWLKSLNKTTETIQPSPSTPSSSQDLNED